jgi:hypothetical protein
MSLPLYVRDSLESLKSKFDAKAETHPGFKHVVIEIPYPAPERRPVPFGGQPVEQLRYEALVQAAFVASWAGNRESAEQKLVAFARRLGLPEDEADAIIRSGFEEIKAHIDSAFGKATSEARRAANYVFGCPPSGRLLWVLPMPENAIHIFINDRGYEDANKAYEAFWPLAERAVKILAAQGFFEPSEAPPDPSELGWFEGKKAYYALQWLTFLHQQARARPGALPSSDPARCLEHVPLKEGGVVHTLEPGMFEASSMTIKRILRETIERAPSPAASPEGESEAPAGPAPPPREGDPAAAPASVTPPQGGE